MKPTCRNPLRCIVWCIALSVVGCARASKEPEKATAAAAETAAPVAAPTFDVRESERTDVSAGQADEANGASSPAAPAQAAKQEAPPRAPERRQVAPPSAAARPRGAGLSSAKPASRAYARAPEPTPTFAEPPELRAALVEFDAQWERLSSSRACDDACRAFESMRRSAQRICDLVIGSDPHQRCRTARARLDQASRDLAARCSDCQQP